MPGQGGAVGVHKFIRAPQVAGDEGHRCLAAGAHG